jgi:hypothetical protein
MPKTLGWKGLLNAIGKLNPEGNLGFEGLIKTLFENETGKSFYLSRKGDQPSGDVFSPTAGVVLEAKRYTQKSQISEDKIEGEIDRVLREINSLDLFVVAATKSLGQLVARLETKTVETGLDILALPLSSELTEFGALCVNNWQVVEGFIPKLGSRWQTWAMQEAARPETKAALQRLRESLSGVATREFVGERASHQLFERFIGRGAGARNHNRVILLDSISRAGLEKMLHDWWKDQAAPIGVLEGDEGMGKTWVASAFVESLVKAQSVVTFWLDSLAWEQSESVESLVEMALQNVFSADDKLCIRIKRKIFHLWQHPILLVLDGANERKAWKAAERILQDYVTHSEKLRARVRLLFTTRPLEQRTARHEFWRGCRVIKVGPFEEPEFRAALTKAAPGVVPEAFSNAVREVAVIPRYFRLCVDLRERLSSLEHLNKQILLWADLQAKLESGDPQFELLKQELQGGPTEILAGLARKAGWPKGGKASLSTEELKRTFPNFLKVREDLIEQRFVMDASYDLATLSADHVILGWALVLSQLAKQHSNDAPEHLRDRLLRELEPAAANDDKVRAVHVAALLTFLQTDKERTRTESGRVALLCLWVMHHNAFVREDELRFFVQRDIAAYMRAVEVLFQEFLPGNLEKTLITPLAQCWREESGETNFIRRTLKRWLKLIFPGGASGSEERNIEPFPGLIVAESAQQLRLSYAAISIISFRCEAELLPDLVDCYGSQAFCYMDRNAGGVEHRHSIKSPGSPLGILLRWSYTESIIPNLDALSSFIEPNNRRKSDLLWFAMLLRIANLPPTMGLARDIYVSGDQCERTQFDTFRAWLQKPEARKCGSLGVASLGCLAVRRDFPSLNKAERDLLSIALQGCIESDKAIGREHYTHEYELLHNLLPWLARYAPKEFEETVLKLWAKVISNKESLHGLLEMDELLPAFDPAGELVRSVLCNADKLLAQRHHDAAIVPVTELMLLHADLDQLLVWLEHLQDKAVERSGHPLVGTLPLPEAFEALAPPGLCEAARERFIRAHEASSMAQGDKSNKQTACFWLHVFAYTANATKEVGEWALQILDKWGNVENLNFGLFLLLCKCEDTSVFRRALMHPALQRFKVGYNSWRWTRLIPESDHDLRSFESLRKTTSYTVAGSLLNCNACDTELRKWGKSLTADALLALEADTRAWIPETDYHFEIRDNHNLGSIGPGYFSDGGTSWHDISSPAWGIDRQTKRSSLNQSDFDRIYDKAYSDLQKLRTSPRDEFIEFNATAALLRYGQLEPEAFVGFAENFLERLWGKGVREISDLSFFATSIRIVLFRLNPELALKYNEYGSPGVRYRVFTFDGALAWDTRELWACELNTVSEVVKMRNQLLNDAPNDEVLFWHVAAAQVEGNAKEMICIANEWVGKAAARDRALGVVIMGYLGDPDSIAKLNSLACDDQSYWIRELAIWASEVCSLEVACKQKYIEICKNSSLRELAHGLGELRMALTPMARAWRHTIDKENFMDSSDGRRRIYLNLFWYHWGNTSSRKKGFAVLGRKLSDTCRGEQLKDGVTNRQFPWWKITEFKSCP